MYVDESAGDSKPTGPRMKVDPDRVKDLADGLEAEATDLRTWLQTVTGALTDVPSLGTDPCSRDLARVLSTNGQSATDAAQAYIDQLQAVADELRQSATDYRSVDEQAEGEFRRRGHE